MSPDAGELVVGAIDMHCHHGPDPRRARSVDAAEAVAMTHALETLVGPDHRLADVVALAERGATIEFTCLTCIPGGIAATEAPETFAHAMMTVGPERAIMSTDFGQAASPHPADGMRLFIAEMLRCGVSAPAIDLMARRNPARLLGLA